MRSRRTDPTPPDHPFTPDLFARLDESDDALFYAAPRKLVHLDEGALAAVSSYFAETIPEHGDVLDLMSSWRSHLPGRPRPRFVVGLGMNAAEMRDNPDLAAALVHDLNREPRLPLRDRTFDAALLSVSMQYLVRPLEVFADVARVLRPRASFVVVLSHRCFPTKAVKIWNDCQTMRERMELGMAYFRFAGGFDDVHGVDLRPNLPPGADPVIAVVGRREGPADSPRVIGSGWRRR